MTSRHVTDLDEELLLLLPLLLERDELLEEPLPAPAPPRRALSRQQHALHYQYMYCVRVFLGHG